jgi:hypothetical protein
MMICVASPEGDSKKVIMKSNADIGPQEENYQEDQPHLQLFSKLNAPCGLQRNGLQLLNMVWYLWIKTCLVVLCRLSSFDFSLAQLRVSRLTD